MENKFKPNDLVYFDYKGEKILGKIKYRVTAENLKHGNKQFIGHYIVHSYGMSSTLPEEKLTLFKGE